MMKTDHLKELQLSIMRQSHPRSFLSFANHTSKLPEILSMCMELIESSLRLKTMSVKRVVVF